MNKVFYNQSPTISDVILFDLVMTDANGDPVDVYEINSVVIYMISRSRGSSNAGMLTIPVDSSDVANQFAVAIPVATFGDVNIPAWIVVDPADGMLTKEDFNSSGQPQSGVYRLEWTPEQIREGDFVICYQWTVMFAGDSQYQSIPFYVLGDTSVTTAVPFHQTVPGKYDLLMDKYLPMTYKTQISKGDLTTQTIIPLNQAVARGFTDLENMANQVIDLYDANAVKDRTLPYLANLFNLKLRSSDSQLWRRQIKEAVPLFKRKGTYGGLNDALAAAGIKLLSLTQLWQVKSSALYTDGFFVTSVTDPIQFTLSELAVLPVDPNNFSVSVTSGSNVQVLSSDYVSLQMVNGATIVTWVGDQLSVDPVVLAVEDLVNITYQIGPILDQEVEDYIQTLPLFDLRTPVEGLLPLKNWNVRVVEESDLMFPLLCPVKHPFAEPVVWGQVRTEFAYSENAYNLEEYNGSLRDSTSPCDMDQGWLEACSCCLSSKFIINMEVSGLSGERMTEATEILDEYKPFHAVAHQINFLAGVEDYILSPNEEIEFLIMFSNQDNVIITQNGFNRLIPEGALASVQHPNRSDLATPETIFTGSGVGFNNDVVFYSPGTSFESLPLSEDDDNLLEVLSGPQSGRYTVTLDGDYLIRLNQGSPSSTNDPLSLAEVPYRLSNFLYSQSGASVYQRNNYSFFDSELDVNFYPIQSGWLVVVTSGVYSGVYSITSINTDGTLSLSSFPAAFSVSGLSYQLQTNTNVVVFTGFTGSVTVMNLGLVEIDAVSGIEIGDFVEYSGVQYQVSSVYSGQLVIQGYSGGTVVGSASVNVLRRLASGSGFLNYEGMTLQGSVPVVDDTLEDNEFLENFEISINGNSYQISAINGDLMSLNGPMLIWGLSGQSVSYSINQYIKTSPITVQTTGVEFLRLDRRGNDQVVITESAPPAVTEMISGSEQISITIQYR